MGHGKIYPLMAFFIWTIALGAWQRISCAQALRLEMEEGQSLELQLAQICKGFGKDWNEKQKTYPHAKFFISAMAKCSYLQSSPHLSLGLRRGHLQVL